jgi:hypothetical protein
VTFSAMIDIYEIYVGKPKQEREFVLG